LTNFGIQKQQLHNFLSCMDNYLAFGGILKPFKIMITY
jgi:hypothetical protein